MSWNNPDCWNEGLTPNRTAPDPVEYLLEARRKMEAAKFELLVRRAYEGLPAEFLARIENVVLEIKKRPSRAELRAAGVPPDETLLGLYHGIPLTERAPELGGNLPDRVTIYQEPIEDECTSDAEIVHEIQATVIHEYGHYFGLTDEEMEAIEDGSH